MALSELFRTRGDAPGDRDRVRAVTPADADWLLALARHSYPEWQYAESDARKWIIAAAASPGVWFRRGRYAALCLTPIQWFFRPEVPEVHSIFAAAYPDGQFELLGLYRASVDWARGVGADRIRMGADTHVDFGPIARALASRERLVVTQDAPAYTVRL